MHQAINSILIFENNSSVWPLKTIHTEKWNAWGITRKDKNCNDVVSVEWSQKSLGTKYFTIKKTLSLVDILSASPSRLNLDTNPSYVEVQWLRFRHLYLGLSAALYRWQPERVDNQPGSNFRHNIAYAAWMIPIVYCLRGNHGDPLRNWTKMCLITKNSDQYQNINHLPPNGMVCLWGTRMTKTNEVFYILQECLSSTWYSS